jgi:hypothetical protein
MILRRLTKHIKEQNWFAVGLDFLIVVFGVFIGLQVQNWTTEQGRRQLELRYTERLHDEAVNLLATRTSLMSFRDVWLEGVISATPAIYGQEDRDLTPAECEAIGYSYIVTNPTDDLASLIELQGSGQLSLFRNDRVSQALRNYVLLRSRARDAGEGIARSLVDLPNKYPQMLRVVTPSPGPGIPAVFECDLDAMRSDQAFLNNYQTTQNSYISHVGNNARVTESLAELHAILDDVLGIVHEEEPAP